MVLLKTNQGKEQKKQELEKDAIPKYTEDAEHNRFYCRQLRTIFSTAILLF